MGKRVKKKAKSGLKENKVSNSLPKAVDDGVVLEKERKVCAHFENAVDLAKVSSKLESAKSTGCEDCRENVINPKDGKRKGKHSKNKSGSNATWVCLLCGHFSCGGVGLPNSRKTHAIWHASQSRHPLVIQLENTNRRWCFSCSTLIPVDKVDDNGEQNDVLLDIVKLLKKQSSNVNSEDVEDLLFRSGRVISNAKSENNVVNLPNGADFYTVNGLANLGNTCFFNSVMQNLLAIDMLRDYLLTYEGSMGPLTRALKKIFVETSHEFGPRNVVNPQPVFGCISAKASQFRGYEQQDSHELLRCMLDQLSTEDLRAKKSFKSSHENGASIPASPTFIDTIFGGKISSTVCCVECGHTSVVHESFLDLSLPLPVKRPPPKKAHPASRTKKTKLPPKRASKHRQKLNKDGDSRPTVSNDKGLGTQDYNNFTQPINPSTEVSRSDSQEYDEQNLTVKSKDVLVGLESKRNGVNDHIGSFQEVAKLSEELDVDTGDNNVKPQFIVGDGKRDADMCSPAVGNEEDTLDFIGLGDLFDEPEVVETATIVSYNMERSAHLRNGFQAGNSDSDEVDDTDLPLSVESCLAQFVKAELLSGEHAWHCENCSKLLQQEKQKLSKDEGSSSEVLQVRSHPCSDCSNSVFVAHSNGFGPTSPKEQRGRCEFIIADQVLIERPSRSEKHESEEDGVDDDINSNSVKAMRDATKKMLIDKTPTILTIHLKRFAQDRRGRLSKLKGHVAFKEFIDLRPFLDNRSTVSEKCIYHLVGVVVHSGSMTGGHYVAFVRGGDKRKWRSEEDNHRPRHNVWYYASDAYVRETTLEEVLRSEAYILFYEKVQL